MTLSEGYATGPNPIDVPACFRISPDKFEQRTCFCEDRSFSCAGSDFDDLAMMTSLGATKAVAQLVADVDGVEFVSKLLGKGTYCEVWQCKFRDFEQQVAIKIIGETLLVVEGREAQLLKELVHPNLVQLLAVVHGKGSRTSPAALVLELCSGGTLTELLYGYPGRALQTYSISQRLRTQLDIANAVTYLHSLDIMHRDIKPSNALLIDDSWRCSNEIPPVKLCDLGLARMLAEHMTTHVGTFLYMAPEHMTQDHYGKPADVYSMAVMINEFATCERPYAQLPASKKDMLRFAPMIAQGHRPDLCSHAGLQRMIIACWCVDPTARWPVVDVALFLHRIVDAVNETHNCC